MNQDFIILISNPPLAGVAPGRASGRSRSAGEGGVEGAGGEEGRQGQEEEEWGHGGHRGEHGQSGEELEVSLFNSSLLQGVSDRLGKKGKDQGKRGKTNKKFEGKKRKKF